MHNTKANNVILNLICNVFISANLVIFRIFALDEKDTDWVDFIGFHRFLRITRRNDANTDPTPEPIPELGFWPDSLSLREGFIKSGQTFSGLMTSLGMSSDGAYKLYQACDSLFDVRTLRAGNTFDAYYQDSLLQYVVYNAGKVNRVVFQCFEPYSVWNAPRQVEYEQRYTDVTITSSLWNDLIAHDASPDLILKLADIYAWTVDFFGLREGDRFRVLYRERVCDGEVVGIDGIDYAEFLRGSTVLPAVFFDQGDGRNSYWNEKGESMQKAFLKAPLKFTRISSGFSYHRKHPVHGDVRPHTGVDYAAPTGTPVMSIGDGTVISKGWGGGGVNTLKVRHNSVYTTAYLHLSKYASGINVGTHVRQGQVIGYVGMTGTATGPHLDFRVWKNGTAINPLTMESPPSEPVRKENMPIVDSLVKYRSARLDSLLRHQ